MSTNFNDTVIKLLTTLDRLEEAMRGINDYGEITGFCDEEASIRNGLSDDLGRYSSRVYTLLRRIERYKAQLPEQPSGSVKD